MSRILLFLEHRENRRLLSEWLTTRYQILVPNCEVEAIDESSLLEYSFDLCIMDEIALDRHWKWVQARRQAEQPVYLPFLLVTSRQDVGMVTRQLWQNIDGLITRPIEKVELQAQVEVLLRSRQYSMQLKAANEELQTEMRSRQRLESALTESEAKFRALVQNSSDIITVLQADGTVGYTSPSSQNVLGFSPEELVGNNIFDFVHSDDLSIAIAAFTASLNESSETQISEYRMRHQNGSWRYIESKSKCLNLEPSLQEIIVNSRDITERKQAEVDIINGLEKKRELNELKSRFVAMVSHDIRNPLNGILMAAELLEHYGEQFDSEKKHELFGRIKTYVKRMVQLLDDVLIIGKVEQSRLEVKPALVDLEKFSRTLIEEIKLSTSSQQQIVFDNQGQCTSVYLNENLLHHIFTNLLSNAIKYSPQGSTIYFNLICQDREAIFQIQDEGIGIPSEDQHKLFESFHRAANIRNIPGTGLGLAIVKRYVDICGGAIAFTSKIGIGTTFTVTLPLDNYQPIDAN